MGIDTSFWQFWVDRGGTFTDIVARTPEGEVISHKLLSENPQHYTDAASYGIREVLALPADQPLPLDCIEEIKVGTTVATNALLEKKGEPTLLVTSHGLADVLKIGGQTRPDIFAIHIDQPEALYIASVAAAERVLNDGTIDIPLDELDLATQLEDYAKQGIKSIAIAFTHSYLYPQHELIAADVARDLGFTQISLSHQVSPLIKLVPRGHTTVVDAYLTPVLRKYIHNLKHQLGFSSGSAENSTASCQLKFMQSNGGLADAVSVHGKDAVLSGPAGGIVGMVESARADGFHQLIGFDMGGTSTDVSHYSEEVDDQSSSKKVAEYERTSETLLEGVNIRTPMLNIHTVAAGGGSIIHFTDGRFQVGPESAGAYPGPCGYGNNGPLTVTDCNILLGKVRPEYFPNCFGDDRQQPLNVVAVKEKFQLLTENINQQINAQMTAEEVALGFLTIAVDNMANAVKKISVQRGYDIESYTLNAFGGAGAQHACLVADALNMKQVYLHPLAGVLSAYGIGLASERWVGEETLHIAYDQNFNIEVFEQKQQSLVEKSSATNTNNSAKSIFRVHIKYQGTDNTLLLSYDSPEKMVQDFHLLHHQTFGFSDPDRTVIFEALQLETVSGGRETDEWPLPKNSSEILDDVEMFSNDAADQSVVTSYQSPVYQRTELTLDQMIQGPAIIIENNSTIIIEPFWQAKVLASGALLLEKDSTSHNAVVDNIGEKTQFQVNPVRLEIFNNVFMAAAEQMGFVLEKTAVSVNIKERLDFSCAIFDIHGELVANAPHIPVHLGSMSESIKTVIKEYNSKMKAGDAFILNTPYNGGTHLPDITVVKPVFLDNNSEPQFYVASRGHHADVGGITPGSMPANSQHIDQEGVLIDNLYLMKQNELQELSMRDLFASGQYPARNIDQNIADLKAQLAACEKGAQELNKLCQHYGVSQVHFYMQAVQDNAEQTLRETLQSLSSGSFIYPMDDGSQISVAITINKNKQNFNLNTACIDFTGTSAQHAGNFNAPSSVAKAAVLYVFRCLVNKPMPLNAGFFRAMEIIIPEDSMLSPQYPAAVVSGNVETAQYVVDTLMGALGVMAGCQGTNNNFTFGNDKHQYYETLCGGVGASKLGEGASAVHSHMTNSRLTDVEVLEQRFPVVLEHFCIRPMSGGNADGKGFNGGNGVERHIRFLEKMEANIISGHRQVPTFSINNEAATFLINDENPSHQGKTGIQFVKKRIDGETQLKLLKSCDYIELNAGDVFCIHTPGGGAFITSKGQS